LNNADNTNGGVSVGEIAIVEADAVVSALLLMFFCSYIWSIAFDSGQDILFKYDIGRTSCLFIIHCEP